MGRMLREQAFALWRKHHEPVRKLAVRGYQLKVKAEYLLRKSRPHRALIILGTGRSGSNMLVSFLDSHPVVTMKNEVLNPWTLTGLGAEYEEVDHDEALRHVIRSINHTKSPVSGVKLLHGQVSYFKISPSELESHLPGAYFILCYRRSLTDQYLSGLLAERTGAWVSGERKKEESPRFRIDIEAFRDYCENVKRANTSLIRELAGVKWLPIAYEDLSSHPDDILATGVFTPLGLAPHQVTSLLRKQNTRPLEEVIENFEEVSPLLEESWTRQEYTN